MPYDFNARVDREDIFRLTIGNKSLHKISNGNGVKVVGFVASKNLSQKYVPTLHPYIYLNVSRGALRPTQPLTYCVPRDISPVLERPWIELDHLLSC
jgi:hypothetical protein